MPFAVHRGQRIHYTVEGEGSLVLIQHGLLLDAESWKRTCIINALKNNYRVACVDSLGHGLSDKPPDFMLYDQQQRAGDIVAVINDLGETRAHLIGHSMGGWMAVGAAKYYPQRLASLTIGGWGLVDGLPPSAKGPITFEGFMKFARTTAPQLVEWVTSDNEHGLRACFDALRQLDGASDAVLTAPCPVMLWNGRGDTYHDPMRTFAAVNGLRFLSTEGDHLGMLFKHGSEGAQGIRAFLESV